MDDYPSIVDNPTIRSIGASWFPPRDSAATVSGRPLLNVSLALNHSLSGTEVWSYHALNLLIHVLAGCALYGVVHRTLLLPSLATRFGADAWWLALAVALLWVIHPIQTESVTYIVQRAESLVGLFYLLAFYFFIRSATSPHRLAWSAAAFVSSLCGMATKEVMSTAPLLLLLYDRFFLAGSWRETWRMRSRMHLAFASGWLLLALLIAASGWRGGSVGVESITPATYALTQTYAVVTYLKLALAPVNLVFDYGVLQGMTFNQIAPYFFTFLLLVAAAAVTVLRWPKLGYCCLVFFVVLAPTSTVIPVATQTMAEHRMYLPLAGVMALVVVLVHLRLGRPARWLFVGLAIMLGFASYDRNALYRSSLALWQDTVAKRPDNARAYYTIGLIHQQAGRDSEAEAAYERSLQLDPTRGEAATNLGQVQRQLGKIDEAEATLTAALRSSKDAGRAVVLNNLADIILIRPGREAEAVERLQEAVRLDPDAVGARYNLAMTLDRTGRASEALPHFHAAVSARPDDVQLRGNYANALMETGEVDKAVAEFQAVVRLQPSAGAFNNLGVAQAMSGRTAEARASFERALEIDPGYQQVRDNLARVNRALND
jgi:tetratricopeptide (TPR) repeat protein